VQYHLQTLLVRWMQWDASRVGVRGSFGTAPAWQHVVGLVAYAAVLFGVAAVILRWRELVAAPET